MGQIQIQSYEKMIQFINEGFPQSENKTYKE